MTEADAKALSALDAAALARRGWRLTVCPPPTPPSFRLDIGYLYLGRPPDGGGGGTECFVPGELADALARLLRRFGVRA